MRGRLLTSVSAVSVMSLALGAGAVDDDGADVGRGKEAAAVKKQPAVEIDLSATPREPVARGKVRVLKLEGDLLENEWDGEIRLSGNVRIELPGGAVVRVRAGAVRVAKNEQGRMIRILVFPAATAMTGESRP